MRIMMTRLSTTRLSRHHHDYDTAYIVCVSSRGQAASSMVRMTRIDTIVERQVNITTTSLISLRHDDDGRRRRRKKREVNVGAPGTAAAVRQKVSSSFYRRQRAAVRTVKCAFTPPFLLFQQYKVFPLFFFVVVRAGPLLPAVAVSVVCVCKCFFFLLFQQIYGAAAHRY